MPRMAPSRGLPWGSSSINGRDGDILVASNGGEAWTNACSQSLTRKEETRLEY
jgi:hypothetical protein